MSVARADGAEYVRILSDELDSDDRSFSVGRPAWERVSHPSETPFILKEKLYRSGVARGERCSGGLHKAGKFFLNSSCSSFLALGCFGRGVTFRHP